MELTPNPLTALDVSMDLAAMYDYDDDDYHNKYDTGYSETMIGIGIWDRDMIQDKLIQDDEDRCGQSLMIILKQFELTPAPGPACVWSVWRPI